MKKADEAGAVTLSKIRKMLRNRHPDFRQRVNILFAIIGAECIRYINDNHSGEEYVKALKMSLQEELMAILVAMNSPDVNTGLENAKKFVDIAHEDIKKRFPNVHWGPEDKVIESY